MNTMNTMSSMDFPTRDPFEMFDDLFLSWASPNWGAMPRMLEPQTRPSVWRKSLDMRGFRESDVTINKQDSHTILIEGKRYLESEHGADTIHRKRKVTLPDDVDGSRMTSLFGADGALLLTAPYRNTNTISSSYRPLPITGGRNETLESKPRVLNLQLQPEPEPLRVVSVENGGSTIPTMQPLTMGNTGTTESMGSQNVQVARRERDEPSFQLARRDEPKGKELAKIGDLGKIFKSPWDLVTAPDGGKRYQLKLPLGMHARDPSDVRVTVQNRMVTAEIKEEDSYAEGYSRRHEVRSFSLPHDVASGSVRSQVSGDNRHILIWADI